MTHARQGSNYDAMNIDSTKELVHIWILVSKDTRIFIFHGNNETHGSVDLAKTETYRTS